MPLVGIPGSALSGYAGWLGVVALAETSVATWALFRRRTGWRMAIAALTALTLIGSVVITARLVVVGRTHGVAVNPLSGTPDGTSPDESVTYTEHGGRSLTIAIWKPVRPADVTTAAPVAFFVHGGGWIGGSATEDHPGLKPQLVAQGWLVVSVEYTSATESSSTWNLVDGQIGCAMTWASSHAEIYGGDPARFVMLGDSAGGNLAINAAYRANARTQPSSCGGRVPTVAAVAVVYPAVDPAGVYHHSSRGAGLSGKYVGGSPALHPERYAAVNSSTYISASSPPTLIIQGENDHLVPAETVYPFAENARAAGIELTMVRIPYGEHGFDTTPMGGQLYRGITADWMHDQVTS